MQDVAPIAINTRLEAQQALRRGVRVASLRAGAEAARDNAVVRAGEVNKRRIERLTQEEAAIRVGLEAWARKNRAEFGDKQQIEFDAGVLNFRVGNRYLGLIPRWQDLGNDGWKKVLQQMVKAGRILVAWRPWIKIKFELDRRKILSDSAGEKPKLTADKLAAVGLQVSQDESFEVEFRVQAKP